MNFISPSCISFWQSWKRSIVALVFAFFLLFINGLLAPTVANGEFKALDRDRAASITFYSHEFGENFPHAFIVISPEGSEPNIPSEAFGFSAKSLSPAILMGSVKGAIKIPKPRYIRQSTPHFSMPVNAQQLAAIQALRVDWDTGNNDRYHLKKRNCVHFVAEILRITGLKVDSDSEYHKKPHSYLEEVAALNAPLFTTENVTQAQMTPVMAD